MEKFGSRLKLLRGERSKSEFSRILGISNVQTYTRYENGRIPEDVNVLCNIANRCGVTVDWLLGRNDEYASAELPPSAVRETAAQYMTMDDAVRLIADRFDLEKEDVLRAIADAKARDMRE